MKTRAAKWQSPLTWFWMIIGAPILYVASLGPIIWLDAHQGVPKWAEDMMVVEIAFCPLILSYDIAPVPVTRAIESYLDLWRY